MNEDKKGIYIILLISFILFGFLIGMLLYFYGKPKNIITEKLNGGLVTMSYIDDLNGLSFTGLTPVSDMVGVSFDSVDKYFDFSIETELEEAKNIKYELFLKKDNNFSTVLDENIRVYLEKKVGEDFKSVFEPKTFEVGNLNSKLNKNFQKEMFLTSMKKNKNNRDSYRLRVWLSDKTILNPDSIQNLNIKVLVYAKAY